MTAAIEFKNVSRVFGDVLAGRVAFGPARLMAQYGVYERDGPATVATKKNVLSLPL